MIKEIPLKKLFSRNNFLKINKLDLFACCFHTYHNSSNSYNYQIAIFYEINNSKDSFSFQKKENNFSQFLNILKFGHLQLSSNTVFNDEFCPLLESNKSQIFYSFSK